MKFLIDNALPPALAGLLRSAGHDALHLREVGIPHAPDHEVLAHAVAEDRVIVSADTDFATLLAAQSLNRPSFILFREPELVRATDYAARLLPALPLLAADLAQGAVVVFRAGRIRLRSLPFV